jgi:aspartate-semialdehyde dehydrogenase
MLMGLGSLFQNNLVEWATSMTYQAASGAGAQNMRELITGMGYLYNNTKELLDDPKSAILDIDRQIADLQRGEGFLKQTLACHSLVH